MSRVALRIAIAFVLYALAFSSRAGAANVPVAIQTCAIGIDNTANRAVISCLLNNVVSGNVIIIEASAISTSDAVTANNGETVVCTAGATGTTGSTRTHICHIILGSSHASQTITLTATGGTTQARGLITTEWSGIGAIDAGSATGASGSSVSTTTAGSNEILFNSCRDSAQNVVPGSGFSQVGYVSNINVNVAGERTLGTFQLVPNATTLTSACTSTGGSSPVIAALAFSVSGAPTPPAVLTTQTCGQLAQSNGSLQGICGITNVVAGHKVLVGIVEAGTSALGSVTCTVAVSAGSAETCTCPANSMTPDTTYSATHFRLATCFIDLVDSHAAITITSNASSITFTPMVWLQEVVGVNTGVDAGSEANATTTTVNYTTAAANEYTFCFAADSNNFVTVTPMAPASSFGEIGFIATIGLPTNGLVMAKTTVSSGSNTCSYTVSGGTTNALLATMSFGLPTAGSNTPAHTAIM